MKLSKFIKALQKIEASSNFDREVVLADNIPVVAPVVVDHSVAITDLINN